MSRNSRLLTFNVELKFKLSRIALGARYRYQVYTIYAFWYVWEFEGSVESYRFDNDALHRNLFSLIAPKSNTLKELIEILNYYFNSIPPEIVEHYKLNTRVRYASQGDTVVNFVMKLSTFAKKTQKNCKFGFFPQWDALRSNCLNPGCRYGDRAINGNNSNVYQ